MYESKRLENKKTEIYVDKLYPMGCGESCSFVKMAGGTKRSCTLFKEELKWSERKGNEGCQLLRCQKCVKRFGE